MNLVQMEAPRVPAIQVAGSIPESSNLFAPQEIYFRNLNSWIEGCIDEHQARLDIWEENATYLALEACRPKYDGLMPWELQ